MTLRRAISVLAIGVMFFLVAWVYVLAQTPRSPARTRPERGPATTSPVPQNPVTDAVPESPYAPLPPFPVQPAYGTQSISGSFASPAPATADVALAAVKVELTSGLVLAGQVVAQPLPCVAKFGEVSIPLATIRGVRLHDPATATTTATPGGPAATVILDNHDCLTVTLRATQIQIKTEWGTAIVDTPHIRSILLTTDEVQWQEVGGRWNLAPVEKPTLPDASDPPTSARIFIQEEDEAKLGIEIAP